MLRSYKDGLRNWAAGALSGAFEVAEIDVRGIFHTDSISLIILSENSLEFFHHWSVIWRVRCGDEGTAAQTSGEAIEIEFLEIRDHARVVMAYAKEIAHVLLAWVAFFHCGVVRAKFSKQGFVVAQESRRVR